MNINGAVNIKTLETVTDFTKRVNKESSLRLCRKIEKKHPKAKAIHIFLDNASYYGAKWLRQQLEGTKIVLHFLPSYSPNLNLIERLWKFFKKEILYNTYHETFENFLSACKNFFRCRKKYKEELRSLLSEKFPCVHSVLTYSFEFCILPFCFTGLCFQGHETHVCLHG